MHVLTQNFKENIYVYNESAACIWDIILIYDTKKNYKKIYNTAYEITDSGNKIVHYTANKFAFLLPKH